VSLNQVQLGKKEKERKTPQCPIPEVSLEADSPSKNIMDTGNLIPTWQKKLLYTECPRRNVHYFRRVFLV
jgi:hypothetical protein